MAAQNDQNMSAVKLALLARKIRGEVPDASVLQSDPIAVVGLACRFPGGADSPEAYWELLRNGIDAIREVPADRWDIDALYDRDPAAPGKTATRWGGFLDSVDRFDPTFFGIAPREAASMDPQQRLLLEIAFEALDDAGLTQESLSGSQTGVFFALGGSDYSRMSEISQIDAYTGLGTALCVACGRISFLLDLHGPSVTVDTGCSSSLVAVHLACQSLRSGESRTAIAGGVNLMLAPETTISLSKWGFMASDGRCKTFDARADGFVRGEGCGVVVLKRLADALAEGDRVLAVIRGTAVNEDGRSSVLTAPSGPAQENVIREALRNARISPADVSYIEAHGTGTAIGDPIEVEALAEVLGQSAEHDPCYIGAVKTNLGHLEAAAGVAGLIKTVLALQHEYIPRILHFTTINPEISLDGTRLQIASEGQPWPAGTRRRFAGVSSFGFGGTNAHVVLEEAPAVPSSARDAASYALPLSARNNGSLKALAARYAELLTRDDGPSLWDVCHTAALRRTHHEYRAVAVGATKAEIADALATLERGDVRWDIPTGRRLVGRRSGPVFVFCGQGPQWWAMGRQLMTTDPSYRETLQQIAAVMDPVSGWSLVAELSAAEPASRLSETEIAQPAIFAVQVSICASLAARGVEPAAVVGHSVGEIAAAHIAGALTLEQAARIVVHRGRVMQRATGHGRMVAATLTAGDAAEIVRKYPGRLSIAAINAPQSIVLAGDTNAIEDAVRGLEYSNTTHRMLPVNYAFHSHQMLQFGPELLALIRNESAKAPVLPFISSVTGSAAQSLSAEYWVGNLTQPVHFAAAIRACEDAGYDTYIEIGPHPVLSTYIADSITGPSREKTAIIATLHRGRPEMSSILAAVGRLHTHGHQIDWRRLYPSGRTVALPPYAWQRERYWLNRATTSAPPPKAADDSPLVGTRLRSPLFTEVVFERELSATTPSFVADHRIHGVVVFPATGFIAMAIGAVAEARGRRVAALRNLTIEEPLILDDEARRVQIIVSPDGESASFRIVSFVRNGERWAVHATGIADVTDVQASPVSVSIAVDGDITTSDAHYHHLATRGCEFGPRFRRVRQTISAGHAAVAQVEAGSATDIIDPGVLDSCLQALNPLIPGDASFLPVGVDTIRFHGPLSGIVRALATIDDHTTEDTRSARIVIADETGRLMIDIDGFRVRRVSQAAVARALKRLPEGWLHTVAWEESPVPAPGSPLRVERWLILSEASTVADQLSRAMEASSQQVVRLATAADTPFNARLLAEQFHSLKSDVRPAGIVLVPFTDQPLASSEPDADDVQRRVERFCQNVLATVQAMVGGPLSEVPLWIITRGAQQTGYEVGAADPIHGALIGLGRVIALEDPELSCTLVDLDPATTSDPGEQLWFEISARSTEPEVALRAGARLVRRLVPFATRPADTRGPVALDVSARGTLDNLRFVPATRRAPGPGEVEIRVRATGLNFRDVLNVLGMYPGQAGAPGDEVAGTIVSVGEGVDNFTIGDDVVGLASACFATYAIAPATGMIRKPAALTFAEAATVPSAFLTAYYALERIAHIGRGDRVLIHAAAGGVGLAAVQLALSAGAEVFATAGSESKRRYLRSLGVAHVMNSRTLDFASEIMTATGGRGVDVVLNSLAGEFIPKSLSVMAPNGRFVEIGRTGVWDAARVAAGRSDIAYTVLFLVDEFAKDPSAVATALTALYERIVRGELSPLPGRVFPLTATVDAFRLMAQAKHLGKVVVVQEEPVRSRDRAFDANGTYLVTGAFGALGLLVARRIVEDGGRALLLVGRTAPSPAAMRILAELRERGAVVTEVIADVARPDGLAAVSRALIGMPALRGLVHAAGVLDDGVLTQQSAERFARVLAPKVAGTWNLHTLTRGMALDFFVMFSGGASLLGARGQGSYAAANAFLDGMAWHRQRYGHPAIAINWGAWSGSGMAAALSERDQRRMTEQGASLIASDQGLNVFEQLVQYGSFPQIGVLPLDWRRYLHTAGRERVMFERLLARADDRAGVAQGGASFAEVFAAAASAAQPKLLLLHVRERVLRVLGLPSTLELDVNQGLRDLGLDSLMAVELRNVLQTDIGRSLPATLAFDHPTVAALTKYLKELLAPAAAPAAPAANAPTIDNSISELTDEEAEAQLAAELAALEQMDIHGH